MSRVIQRKGDPSQRKQANDNIAQIAYLRTEYSNWQHKLQARNDEHTFQITKLKDINNMLLQTRDVLSGVEEEIDMDPLPEGAQPKARIQRRDNLRIQISQLEAGVKAQKEATRLAFEAVADAERRVFQADKSLSQYVDALEKTEKTVAVQEELDKIRAEKLAKQEVKRVKRWEAEQKAAVDARANQIQELARVAEKQVEAAKAAHVTAAARVNADLENTRLTSKMLQETNDEKIVQKTAAILELKNNISLVRAELVTQSDRQQRKIADAKKQLEDEKDMLLSKGLNPYAEFRRKELDAQAQALESKLKSDVENNKVSLLERMAREEAIRKKEDAKKLEAHEHEKRYRDSQGRQVVEESNRKYITSITIGAKEVLDPSGRAARVDPSQVTEITDNSFGLGKSSRIPKETMAKITEKIRAGLKVSADDLGEYQRFVNAYLTPEEKAEVEAHSLAKSKGKGRAKSASFADPSSGVADLDDAEAREARREQEKRVAELQTMASVTGLMPGFGAAASTINIGDEAEKKALLQVTSEEIGGDVKASLGVEKEKSPKYKTVQMSKFEQDSFARAKEMQKTRLEQGTVQVAGGRVFQGTSFVSKPAEILFKDFVVGKKYKKVFTLTNASFTFNSFKLLALSDDIIDFFVITYEKPGRISAGVSCSLEIVFSPQINKEIFSAIKLQTETGPVEIPLTCLIKRCAPRIQDPVIDFGTVVIGQKLKQMMRVVNTEALDTTFFVEREAEPESPQVLALGENRDELGGQPDDVPAISALDIKLPDPTEDVDFSLSTSEGPALNEAELNNRVRRVLTQIQRKKKRDDPFPLSFKESEGFVSGYDKTTMEVVCAPLQVGEITQRFLVEFDGVTDGDGTVDAQGVPITREQYVTVKVKGEEVPIYLEDVNVDMKCTLYGRIYRKRLEVKNRGQISFRLNISVPSPLNKYIEVNPLMLFVQAKSSQAINIKFTPTVGILTELMGYSVPYEQFADAALMAIPVQLEVVNQELPVYFVLRSIVCPSTLQLSMTTLDYGNMYVNQQSSLKLTVKNISMQPQKVAFVRVPTEIAIQPNEGFAVLLPNEDVEFEVFFCPLSAVTYDLKLTVQSSLNDSYVLNVKAQGIEPPVTFSCTSVHMRTTGPGERVVESVVATNTSKKSQCFEIAPPNAAFSWLKISPTVVDLAPGQSARIELEYLPPRDAISMDPIAWRNNLLATIAPSNVVAGQAIDSPLEDWVADSGWFWSKGLFGSLQWMRAGAGSRPAPPPIEDVEDGAVVEAPANDEQLDLPIDIDESEWGIFGRWNIPVFIKPRVRPSSPSETSRPSKKGPQLPLFLSIQTVVVMPQLEIDANSVDFGQMALGTRQLKVLKLRNLSRDPIHLHPDGLSAVGPFTVLNYSRVMQPGEFRNVIVECLPLRPGLFIEVLELAPSVEIGGHRLRITLRTEGMKPSVSLEGVSPPPASWGKRDGILNFGNVVAGDVILQKFSVSNKSKFAVNLNITRLACAGMSPVAQAHLIERTASGLPVITFRPEILTVGPDSSQQIEVFFRPDRGRFVPFREDLRVRVGDTDEVLTLGIVGRAWARQAFVVPGNPLDEPFVKNVDTLPSAYVEDALLSSVVGPIRSSAAEAQTALGVKPPPQPPITLEFPDPFSETADPSSYVDADSAQAAGGKGGKAPVGKAGAGAGTGGRLQKRKVLVTSAKINDTRVGSGNGTFEVVFSANAKDSGLFSVSVDKGAVNMGTETAVEFSCTLPKPRGIGGLAVGSWINFDAEIVLKGGWVPPGDSDENRVPIVLRAYVSL